MQIRLNRMKFYARHGVLPQEAAVGALFEVSLTLSVDDADASGALFDDRLEHTVNYAEVHAVVRREMDTPSALLERVAARVARAVVRQFPLVRQAEVAVTKCTPPISGFDAGGVTVSYALRRTLVAWDFDGTIADTRQGILRTMQLTLQRCRGVVPPEADICNTIGLPLRESIRRLSGFSGDALDRAVAVYHELFETEGAALAVLFPGVAEAIRRQHIRGAFVAIATSRGHASTARLCRQLGIADCIDHIVACEDVQCSKPHAEPVLKLCALTHTLPADTTVIGDTTYDVEMGLNAGAGRVVGVAWGNHSPEQLLRAGADCVADSAGAL